jgi:glyoxylase-like metal-dependent hydrolase (beta-lactamase superfamily II)
MSTDTDWRPARKGFSHLPLRCSIDKVFTIRFSSLYFESETPVLRLLAALFVLFAAAFWWLLLDARTPGRADSEFDLAAYRALIADDVNLPEEIRIEIVGKDEAPRFAAEAGAGFEKMRLYYTAVQIAAPDATVIIGGAVDDLTAAEIAQSQTAQFYADAYGRLLAAFEIADQIYITHEHLDHVMAITRHPAPENFAGRLRLTAPQVAALPQFAPASGLAPALTRLAPTTIDAPTRVAPGVVVAPAPGHSPGSQIFFVKRADGREYLFIGDIVWTMTNIDRLKTRPRLLQYLFFDPKEDRKAVLRQVRALHDIAAANPALTIVPCHDGAHIDRLISDGALVKGFG